ncbi:MAG TPA: sulfite exporter TauE/SafE family protein [Burkholderiales bacterium]|nr:sulfite exporter TauE/SafE family protein [Burkholderiales bacterium]
MNAWLQALALAAFSAGLLGGVHCAAMCGGVMTACAPSPKERARGRWRLVLAYNIGRIASYGVAGALVGALGQGALALRAGPQIQHALLVVAGASMLMLAAYMAGVGGFVRRLESAGGFLWRRLAPHTRWFLPANTVPRALGLGALWGWLPCGMVYGVLLTAVATGSAAEGALVMLAFGAGTLPNLLAISAAAGTLKTATRKPAVRKGVALALAALGVFAIAGVIHPAAFAADGLLCRVLPVAAHP